MKRKWPTETKGQRDGDLRKNFTSKQLEAIGAVTIAWNEVEIFLDIALEEALWIPEAAWLHVSTRINGYDGKVAIIKELKREYLADLGEDTWNHITLSLDGLTECKGFRDAVIHARAYDVPEGIGALIRKRAAKEQVLLTEPALNGLVDRLTALRLEFKQIVMLFDALRSLRLYYLQDKSPLERSIQVYAARLQEHQTARRSLPPLPTFPRSRPKPPATEGPPPIVHS